MRDKKSYDARSQKSYDVRFGLRTVISHAKPAVSRRTPATKRTRIRDYAEKHGLSYSAAEERLLDRGLAAEDASPLGEQLPPEVNALFFGDQDGTVAEPGRNGSPFSTWDELVTAWDQWRVKTKPPHTSWWAHWRIDRRMSAAKANERASTARARRVTDHTGESWLEQTQDGQFLVFFVTDLETEQRDQLVRDDRRRKQ